MNIVEPIRRKSDLKKIEKILKQQGLRDLVFFVIGTNCGLIIIDLGHISGDYHSFRLFSCNNIWRISEDGSFKSRQNVPVRKFFNCSEFEFFRLLINDSSEKIEFHKNIKQISEQYEIPSLGLSNPFVCYELSKRLPQNASLHLAILNSLRSMDCFELETGVDVNSNVGGFGIDGALSSVIGQSLVSSERLHFCVIVNGKFNIGYNSYIICDKNAKLELNNGYTNAHTEIYCTKAITIGKNVAIARNVKILDSDWHTIYDTTGKCINPPEPITIGNNVWLGINSIILKGVTIGDNAIVAQVV